MFFIFRIERLLQGFLPPPPGAFFFPLCESLFFWSLSPPTTMGFFPNPFSSSNNPEQQRAEQVRSGARAPDRTERKRCWEARDGYFACLDRNNILDALKDEKRAAAACKDEAVVFERDCAKEWVSRRCRLSRLFFHPSPGCERDCIDFFLGRAVLTLLRLSYQVTYFKKWRVADYQKKQRLAALEAEGAKSVEITSGPTVQK